ncbi:MAG: ribosome silencing factor [Chitinophagales bacterium]|nr:ribosome silencing factor [Chitinophagales bacterium]HNI43253.1 ribosome silencing factor [Chitinophagales bacterium]
MKAKAQQQTASLQQQQIQHIIASIQDKKGVKIVSMDLRPVGSICDYFIICEGNSPPHVRAIADNVMFEMKKKFGINPVHCEGFGTLDWVLVDYFDIVVHVFHKDKRNLYQLEDLWGDAQLTEHELQPTMPKAPQK